MGLVTSVDAVSDYSVTVYIWELKARIKEFYTSISETETLTVRCGTQPNIHKRETQAAFVRQDVTACS
jgi:hypothetical protein